MFPEILLLIQLEFTSGGELCSFKFPVVDTMATCDRHTHIAQKL